MKLRFVLLALAVCAVSWHVVAVIAELDLNFGNQGRVFDLVPGPTDNSVYEIAVQSDAKLIVADTDIRRYNLDGSEDLSFADGGVLTADYGVGRIIVNADDSFFLLGRQGVIGQQKVIVERYLPSGVIDTTFGSSGRGTYDFAEGFEVSARTLLPLSDGSLIVAGCATDDFEENSYYISRLFEDGELDVAFGTNGIVRDDGFLTTCVVDAVEVESDIVFYGWRVAPFAGGCGDKTDETFVLKLDRSGLPVSSFGSAGEVSFDPGCQDSPDAIKPLPSGGLFLTGSESRNFFITNRPFFGQLNADGSPDTNYGTNGVLFLDSPDSFSVRETVMDSNNQILFVGTRYSEPEPFEEERAPYVARLTLDRSGLDPTFGEAGVAAFPPPGFEAEAFGLAIAALPGGESAIGSSLAPSFDPGDDPGVGVLRRLDDEGVPVPEFGNNGELSFDGFAPAPSTARAATGRPDGSLVVVGEVGDQPFAAAYGPDGEVQTDFGDGGYTVIIPPGGNGEARAVAFDGTQGIFVGASVREPGEFFSTTLFGVFRLDTQGLPDPTFGTDGLATANVLNERAEIVYDILAVDGSVVVVGETARPGSRDRDFAMAKFTPQGVLDPSFGDSGVVLTQWNIPDYDNSTIRAIDRQSDGSLVVAGNFSFKGFDSRAAVARYTPAGQLDATFGDAGIALLDFDDEGQGIDLLVEADDSIVLLGTKLTSGNFDIVLAKLTPDGSLATAFGGQGFRAYDRNGRTDRATRLVRDNVGGGYLALADTSEGVSLLKVDAAGEPDVTFGEGGWFEENFDLVLTPPPPVDLVAHDLGQVSVIASPSAQIGIARLSGGFSDLIFEDDFQGQQ